MPLNRMSQVRAGVDPVHIPSADAVTAQHGGTLEVLENLLYCALGNMNFQRNISDAGVGTPRQADQHMRMIRKVCPRRRLVLFGRITHILPAISLVSERDYMRNC
jgi:hypothetical protein